MMKTKATVIFRTSIIFLLLAWAGAAFGQGCLYSTHFDANSPKTIIGSWHNYVTEVKESKLFVTLDDKKGNQWYSWSLEYVGQDGTVAPIDFSIPENKPVVRFRAKASDTVTLLVVLIDVNDKIVGSTEVSEISNFDLTTEFKDYEVNFSGLFYDWDNNKVDSSAIKAIVFMANAGYADYPFTNSFGQLVNKPFGGTIEFDWIGTGEDCRLPENYLNFSVPKKFCKDSLVKIFDYSGNFVNEAEVVLNPGEDGIIVASSDKEYTLKYTSTGEKTIEMSFTGSGIAPSYIEVVKVKDCTPGVFEQKIVGYISSYGDASQVDYANLSHAMYAFLDVKPNGSIGAFEEELQQKNFERFLAATEKTNTKRVISIRGSARPLIPGWTGIEEVAKSAEAIHSFADTIVKFCLHHKLDGVDMDWEGLSTAIERERYTQLMDTLERHLHAADLLLVATLPFNSTWGQWFADEALKKADWLQIMVYDATGSWPQSPFGNHSSFEHLVAAEGYWTGRGYEREQLVMGVPFYGYKFESTAGGEGTTHTYRDITALFPMMDNSMDQTPGKDLTLFNGPDLLKKKCRYLKEKDFGGVMIWEMTQDALGHKSLHQHMLCAFKDDIGCTEFEPCTTGDITTGLVGQWDFDGNTNDKSGNGNHGNIHAGKLSHDRYGESDNAVSSQEHFLMVDCGSDESLQLDELTISAWINPARLAWDKMMVILMKRAGCGTSYALHTDWEYVRAELSSEDKKYSLTSSTLLVPGNWYHIVLTHSYDHGMRLYINGLLDKQDTSKFHLLKEVAGHACGDENLEFGHIGQVSYDGQLDDIRIYNKELSQCSVDGLFYPFYSNEKVTGIFNSKEALGINVYPNPSNGNYTVDLPEPLKEGAVMTITNSVGQKVGEYILHEKTTEIQQNNEDGIYYLTISVGNKRYSGKMVINKSKK